MQTIGRRIPAQPAPRRNILNFKPSRLKIEFRANQPNLWLCGSAWDCTRPSSWG
jgi:hypothetical protein